MNPPPNSFQTPTLVIRALRRVLRPLVRLMVAHGIQYPMLLEMLKSEFVRVANLDFRLDTRTQSDSRISLLTGVHRKDVRRLRTALSEDEPISDVVSLGGQIAACWLSSPIHTDVKGQPLPLPRSRSIGGKVSFEALVESLSRDIRPRVVLDEWLRVGAAHLDSQDRVILNSKAFVPNKGVEEKLHYLAQNGHDHLQAIVHNVSGGQPPMLDRSVYYSQLTPESVRTLAQLAEVRGMKTLQALNKAAADLKAKQKSAAGAVHRINFGMYFYTDPPPASSMPASRDAASPDPPRSSFPE